MTGYHAANGYLTLLLGRTMLKDSAAVDNEIDQRGVLSMQHPISETPNAFLQRHTSLFIPVTDATAMGEIIQVDIE